MGKQNNRICCICGRNYSYCPNCGQDTNKPTWYFIFDSQNCHDIYDVCTNYRDKVIDVDKAYELISKLDISNIDDFAEATRLQIEEIISNGKKVSIKKVNEKNVDSNIKEVKNK